ncbi:hypothetical protein LJR084_004986 [Variovorax sp. LjRoot84]|uniref:hypothetical protein n=1 Tax=Variovorax sp. LjRoot84 TaxID=3342340 RepID=UPI003ECD874F
MTLAKAKPQIEPYVLALKRQEVVRDWLADKEKKAKIEVLLGPAAKPKMSHPQSATRYLEMIATAEQSVDDLFAVQQ